MQALVALWMSFALCNLLNQITLIYDHLVMTIRVVNWSRLTHQSIVIDSIWFGSSDQIGQSLIKPNHVWVSFCTLNFGIKPTQSTVTMTYFFILHLHYLQMLKELGFKELFTIWDNIFVLILMLISFSSMYSFIPFIECHDLIHE